MVAVETASRLHFGLLSFPTGLYWPNHLGQETVPTRRFGGVGLMVQSPGIVLWIQPAKDWSAQGPLADRALAFARRFADSLKATGTSLGPPQEIVIERSAPEHVGLGTGTQLGLAVARALTESWGLPLNPLAVAHHAGRGARSALGCHGFFQGGFLVEAGKKSEADMSPLIARVPFPESWRIVLVIPPWGSGLHGVEEGEAFQRLLAQGLPDAQTETLCRLILLGLLPALAEKDCRTFGEALFDFNGRAGQAFAGIQNGLYASPRIGELIQFIRRLGVPSAGQSSWGPSAFAVVEDQDRALDLSRKIRDSFNLQSHEVLLTSACNQAASIKNNGKASP
jgi:beta-ribofuranosylaminobenzene 5'-phosphate synthase